MVIAQKSGFSPMPNINLLGMKRGEKAIYNKSVIADA